MVIFLFYKDFDYPIIGLTYYNICYFLIVFQGIRYDVNKRRGIKIDLKLTFQKEKRPGFSEPLIVS